MDWHWLIYGLAWVGIAAIFAGLCYLLDWLYPLDQGDDE